RTPGRRRLAFVPPKTRGAPFPRCLPIISDSVPFGIPVGGASQPTATLFLLHLLLLLPPQREEQDHEQDQRRHVTGSSNLYRHPTGRTSRVALNAHRQWKTFASSRNCFRMTARNLSSLSSSISCRVSSAFRAP